MACKEPKTVKKTFTKYAVESATELDKLKKLKIMAISGAYKEKRIFISIDKATVIEVRVYDLSNFSINTYSDFNKKVKKLIR